MGIKFPTILLINLWTNKTIMNWRLGPRSKMKFKETLWEQLQKFLSEKGRDTNDLFYYVMHL